MLLDLFHLLTALPEHKVGADCRAEDSDDHGQAVGGESDFGCDETRKRRVPIDFCNEHHGDVRKEYEDGFRDLVLEKTGNAVHSVGGCTSFYLDEKGKNLLLWPGSMIGMWRRLKHFDMTPYAPVPAAVPRSLPEKTA